MPSSQVFNTLKAITWSDVDLGFNSEIFEANMNWAKRKIQHFDSRYQESRDI